MLPYADSMPMQPIYNNQQPAMIQPTQLTDQNALELIMNLMVRPLEHYQLHHPPQTDVHFPILPNVMANSPTERITILSTYFYDAALETCDWERSVLKRRLTASAIEVERQRMKCLP
ncbi:Peptidyl-prolyl cis-trans isomerase cyp23 [Thalictrum thalictroides]|uniref:Peptidyl-prolyl cis-trans isomerase cyp23 n=1 Tax=Thalictrum thalictroides TaxID=46969 RepID=A0A7J6WKZ3_THATH|nr:Peptidyl-prolyl cis-trans isomerase cyp23 [Thalictrum thalictroides]